MNEYLKSFIKRVRALSPLLFVALGLIFIAAFAFSLLQMQVSYDQQMNDLQADLRFYGVRYIIYAPDFRALIIETVDTEAEFLGLIEKYQPKIVYYYCAISYIRFSFFEDEAECQIAYQWIYDYKR